MAFEGTEKRYQALDDQVIDGPLVALSAKALWEVRLKLLETESSKAW
jgi:hypothetical protein